jgi:hypothetical protein
MAYSQVSNYRTMVMGMFLNNTLVTFVYQLNIGNLEQLKSNQSWIHIVSSLSKVSEVKMQQFWYERVGSVLVLSQVFMLFIPYAINLLVFILQVIS